MTKKRTPTKSTKAVSKPKTAQKRKEPKDQSAEETVDASVLPPKRKKEKESSYSVNPQSGEAPINSDTAKDSKLRELDTILKDIPDFTDIAVCSNPLPAALKFVNREDVIIKIGVGHLHNLFHLSRGTTDTRPYRYGIFIDQMYGSGKTTTGAKLLEKLRELKVELFKYIADRGLDTILQFVETNIETWFDACYVRIAGDQAIGALSVDSMAAKIAWVVGADSSGDIITILDNIKRKHRAILLHIDEVKDDFSTTKMIWTNCVTLEEQAAEHGLMLQYIITGRNTQISRVPKHASPCMPLALYLDALGERHVREIWNAYAPNIPNINIPDDLVDSFIKMLHEKTGGIPRLIVYTLATLTTINKKQKFTFNNESLNFFMNVVVYNQILKVPDVCIYSKNSGTFYRDACLYFMMLTETGQEFMLTETYPDRFPNNDIGTYGDVLATLPFFIKRVENGKCVLVKAQYSYGILLRSTSDIPDDLTFSFLNLQHNKVANLAMNVGALFELILVRAVIRGSQARTTKLWSSVFPFFSQTFVGTTAVQTMGVKEIRRFPKITSKTETRIDFSAKDPMSADTANPTDLPALLELMRPPQLCLPGEASRSSDIYHCVAPNIIVSYAMKAGDQVIGIASLKEEIKKVGNKDRQHVLVLMACTISNQLQLLVASNFVVLDAGEYIYTGNFYIKRVDEIPVALIVGDTVIALTQEEEKKTRYQKAHKIIIDDVPYSTSALLTTDYGVGSLSTDTTEKFTVPANMQVVLLKPSWLPEILGREPMDALKTLSSVRKEKTSYLEYIKATHLDIGGENKRKREVIEVEFERDKKKPSTQTTETKVLHFGVEGTATLKKTDPFEKLEYLLKGHFGDSKCWFVNDAGRLVELSAETYPSLFSLTPDTVGIFITEAN